MTAPSDRDTKTWRASIKRRRALVRKRAVLLDGVVLFVTKFVAEQIAPLRQRNVELEKRIAELEQRPSGVQWCGIFEAKDFQAGSLCTFQGGLWCATRATCERPGEGNSGWKLICKSGAFANGDDDGPRTVRTGPRPNGSAHHRRPR